MGKPKMNKYRRNKRTKRSKYTKALILSANIRKQVSKERNEIVVSGITGNENSDSMTEVIKHDSSRTVASFSTEKVVEAPCSSTDIEPHSITVNENSDSMTEGIKHESSSTLASFSTEKVVKTPCLSTLLASRGITGGSKYNESTVTYYFFKFQFEMCQELYDTIRNRKTEEGRLLCESFIRSPNRRSLADYYKIVTSPIDLMKIQQRLKANAYIDIEQFTSDIELLVTNAKSYYEENSQEYQDACKLWKVFSEEKICKEKEILNKVHNAVTSKVVRNIRKKKSYPVNKVKKIRIDDGNESEPENAESNPQWLLYRTVKSFINSKGDQLSELFWELPPRSFYLDYYNEVKQPISLCIIKTKIKQHQYSSLSKVVADMSLMFKYAKMYNTADSRFFKGALELEEVMQAKAKELANMKEQPIPLTEIIPQHPKGSTYESTLFKNKSRLRYECRWDNCDKRFRGKSHLVAHVVNQPSGHIRQSFKNYGPELEIHCQWYNCQENEEKLLSFPSIERLISHVKVVHLKTLSKNNSPKHQIKKDESSDINLLQNDQAVSFTKDFQLMLPKPSNAAFTAGPARDYSFQSKCKMCNFSDMQVTEARDGLNVRFMVKCTLCPATKVFGMSDPRTEDSQTKTTQSQTHTIVRPQAPLIDLPQAASIKEEFILPDNGTSPFLFDSSSEPTIVPSQVPLTDLAKAASIKEEFILPDDGMNSSFVNTASGSASLEMSFCVDRDGSSTRSGSATMDVKGNIAKNPDVFAQTSLRWPSGQLFTYATMDRTTNRGITTNDTLPVDLNLVKKEVDDEALCS